MALERMDAPLTEALRRIRVGDYADKVVYRHEQTLSKPKADRLDLLRTTRAHYEQLFLLYEDYGEIDSLLSPTATPSIDVADEYGVAHRVWQISDAGVIATVQEKMRDQKLVIADGHHRYETALNFRNECRAAANRLVRLRRGAVDRDGDLVRARAGDLLRFRIIDQRRVRVEPDLHARAGQFADVIDEMPVQRRLAQAE